MWTERLREAAYTSPGGTRITFDYEDVQFVIDKRTSAFNFPDADGTYVQDLGHTGRRFPMTVFLWGDDYDLQAEAFEKVLIEQGTGRLEHPIYGNRDVVPFGTIKRRDDLKTAANQAIFEVVFWETTGIVYPASQIEPAASVVSTIFDFVESAAAEFASGVFIDTAFGRVTLQGAYETTLSVVSNTLRNIAVEEDSVLQVFDSIKASINNGIDILISDPLTLAHQTLLLIQTPALVSQSIQARLSAYSGLLDIIINGEGAAPEAGDIRDINTFMSNDLYALGLVSGAVVSSVNAQFITKPEAIEAAESLLILLDDATVWREAAFTSFGGIDEGASYQQLQESVALAAGFLVQISFSLKQERRVVLDRARTIIDLAAELYGSVDSNLDFLITSNQLTGSEILELPAGREIVYYV